MSKHTPGPWHWYWKKENGETDCGVVSDRGHSVCRAPRYQTRKQWEADGPLIAEAGTVATETGLTPRQLAEQRAELLEALIRLCEAPYTSALQMARLQMARSVIAKAKGEQP